MIKLVLRNLSFILLTVAGLGSSTGAYAITGQLSVTTPSIGTPVRLTLKQGGKVLASGENEVTASGVPEGPVTVLSQVGTQPPQESEAVVEGDKDCRYEVDTATGRAKRIRCVALLVMAQQQYPWSFGLLGGWKRTPFDTTLNSTFGNGSTDLDEGGISLSLEARYNLRRRQQNLGANLFLYGTYVRYFGTSAEKLFLDDHGGAALDTGAGTEEKYGLHLGFGSRWNLAQQLGFELMLGAHATRVTGTLPTLESQGGGSDLVFKRNKFLLGPMVALAVTYPLFQLAGVPVDGALRWTAMRMPDFSVAGSSAFSGGNYSANFGGGWQHTLQFGLQAAF